MIKKLLLTLTSIETGYYLVVAPLINPSTSFDGVFTFPTNQTTFSNSSISFVIPRSNLLDEYITLWSPYSNCCFYPISPDFQYTYNNNKLVIVHDFHIPDGSNFGYWKVELKK